MKSCGTVDRAYFGEHLALAILYGILFLLCVVMLILKRKASTQHWHNLFYVLLAIGSIGRATYMTSQFFVNSMDQFRYRNEVLGMMLSFPSFIYFSAYLIILFRWALIYHNSYDMSALKFAHVKVLFYVFNAVMYTVVIVLYIIDIWLYPPHKVQECWGFVPATIVESSVYAFCAACYFITSVGFVVYTLRITQKFKYLPSRKGSKEEVSGRLQRFTVLVLCVFCVRAVLTIYTNFWDTQFSMQHWYVDGLYYLVLEIVPLVLMFLILRMHPIKIANSNTPGGHSGPNATTPLINNPPSYAYAYA